MHVQVYAQNYDRLANIGQRMLHPTAALNQPVALVAPLRVTTFTYFPTPELLFVRVSTTFNDLNELTKETVRTHKIMLSTLSE